ncbi:NAD-dependent epimerase/dehydratase family protein [Octadecabacter sp. G9-8]|uniref:NAD-dependent epimerase/dehydratase family protein n=1 Tax=Octadecabacter dasysiphoniae TaxID=2909341 RepID=A0ABS9CY15_9RHOB|nr:NAD-dependent epimerase/dehydratase family protein [Octadecabacter dasysiphoniae]MCF2870963.1 NAD-dependent epimerase/dehydratase family protein [Octadecabacter dasysiphoniae]
MKNPRDVVLVGGFGFVGRNILDVMLTDDQFDGLNPIVIDDLSNAAPGHETIDIDAYHGGYQDAGALEFLDGRGAKQGRIFVFLAGETRVAESKDRPLDFIKANIEDPSAFVMRAVRPGDHFILISTAGALFDGTFEVRTTSPFCPKNFYGATKAAEEMVLQKLVELRGGLFSVVRMTNVYGAFSDRKHSAIHAFTRAALEGSQIVINGDGQQSRDFIYAGDVGRAIATQALRVAHGQAVDAINMIGAGHSSTLMDVVDVIAKTSGAALNCVKTPAVDLIATEPRDVVANGQDVQVLLGDAITPLADGIAQTFAYYEGRV